MYRSQSTSCLHPEVFGLPSLFAVFVAGDARRTDALNQTTIARRPDVIRAYTDAAKFPLFRSVFRLCIALSLAAACTSAFAAMDDESAKAFMKEHDCTKCHSVTKTKKGPSYKKIADKHRGKADAMDKLYKQVTTGPKVKLEDGTEEEHKILEVDPKEIREMLQWILTL
jgi:cytochrome c